MKQSSSFYLSRPDIAAILIALANSGQPFESMLAVALATQTAPEFKAGFKATQHFINQPKKETVSRGT